MLKLSRAFPCYSNLQINGLTNCHRKSDPILPSDATQGESSSLLTLREWLLCRNNYILLEMTFQSDTTRAQAKRGFRLGGKVTLLKGNRWAYWQFARWVPFEITKFLLPVQELCFLRTGIPFFLCIPKTLTPSDSERLYVIRTSTLEPMPGFKWPWTNVSTSLCSDTKFAWQWLCGFKLTILKSIENSIDT